MEDASYRTHQRLECFLRRHVSQEVCDALRISEACIVVGQNYGHAFKFVALTDDQLFILANPPQNENDLELTIELQHIKELHQVHDIPDFLSGDLQKNAQHLSVIYENPVSNLTLPISTHSSTAKKSPNLDLKSSLSSSRSLSNTDVFNDGQASERASTIRFKFDDHGADIRDRTVSDPAHVADLPGVSNTAMAIPLRLSTSMLGALDGSSTSGCLKSTKTGSRPLPPPEPGTESTNALTVKNSPRSARRRRKSNEPKSAREDGMVSLDNSMSSASSEPYLGRLDRSRKPVSSSRSLGSSSSHRLDVKSSEELQISPGNSTRSLQRNSSDRGLTQSFSAKIGSLFGKGDDRSPPPGTVSVRKTSDPRLTNSFSERTTDDGAQNSLPEDFIIDIYLLNGGSNFISLLKATRINSIIALTGLAASTKKVKEKAGTLDSSRMLEEFYHLKTEILECTDIEQAFILTKELLAGSSKRPHIKKLFWKTQELIDYYVTTLDAYLIHQDRIKIRGDEADELDYMLIIADVIVCMLFNTEILPARNKILFGHRSSLICKMMKLCFVKPDLIKKQESLALSNAAALLLAGVEREELQSEKEIEIDKENGICSWARDIHCTIIAMGMKILDICLKTDFSLFLREMKHPLRITLWKLNNLLGEWTDACSSLLYELLRATEQCKWTYREGKGISLHSSISLMENHLNIETFMKDMMSRIMGRLLADYVAIKRSDIALLFKQFTVLQWIFENSTTLGGYLSDHYYEEFRYYIGSPKVVDKIPNCPLAQVLRDLISDVTSVAVARN